MSPTGPNKFQRGITPERIHERKQKWKISVFVNTNSYPKLDVNCKTTEKSVDNYCKRGYFCLGKISRKCWQDISRGFFFHDTTHISFIKAYRLYFRVGVMFAKKTKAQKSRKLPPRENFHVYSKFEQKKICGVHSGQTQ